MKIKEFRSVLAKPLIERGWEVEVKSRKGVFELFVSKEGYGGRFNIAGIDNALSPENLAKNGLNRDQAFKNMFDKIYYNLEKQLAVEVLAKESEKKTAERVARVQIIEQEYGDEYLKALDSTVKETLNNKENK